MMRNISFSPDAAITTASVVGAIGAATLATAEAYPELVGMGAVAASVLGMMAYRQKQDSIAATAREATSAAKEAAREAASAAREQTLLARVGKLEDAAQEKLTGLIERQLSAAVKQDTMLLSMNDTLKKLIDSQEGLHDLIEKFGYHPHPHKQDI